MCSKSVVTEKVVDMEEKSQVTPMAKTGLIKERRERGEKNTDSWGTVFFSLDKPTLAD